VGRRFDPDRAHCFKPKFVLVIDSCRFASERVASLLLLKVSTTRDANLQINYVVQAATFT
jgi:hypothetical protein